MSTRAVLILMMAAFLATLLLGCAPLNIPKPKRPKHTLKDQPVSEVIKQWGKPNRSYSDGRGGKILIYFFDEYGHVLSHLDYNKYDIKRQVHVNANGYVTKIDQIRRPPQIKRRF